METITLLGEPKSTGHIYRVNCSRGFPTMYMNKEGKELKESYQWQAKSQWKKKPIKGEVIMTVRLYFGTKRKSDIDNFNKILLDSLTGIVWEDDHQVVDLTIQKYYDKGNPRVEIDIFDAKN